MFRQCSARRGHFAASIVPAALLAFAFEAHAEKLRVIAAGAAVTETVIALGRGADLVGVDTTSEMPADLAGVPKVGYVRTLGAEGLLSLSPTLVIASEEAGPPGVLDQVRAAGVRCVVVDSTGGAGAHARGVNAGANPHAAGNPHAGVNPHAAHAQAAAGGNPHAAAGASSDAHAAAAPGPPDPQAHALASASRTIRGVAEALGEQKKGEEIVSALATDLRKATAPADANRQPALFIVHPPRAGAPLVAGAGTPPDAMLALAGARNAATGVFGYRPLTPEAAIAAAPAIVVVPAGTLKAAGGAAAFLSAAGLAHTPAGKNGRVVEVEPWMMSFGPKTAVAVRELAASFAAPVESSASDR
jgi:iron complex transport system substrate-binding protein